MNKEIYCCECRLNVSARLTNGGEVYKRRPDLKSLPFWICDSCGNFVGCHHKTKDKINPLGVIPSEEIKNYRKHIHKILDPLWTCGLISRSQLYKEISKRIGFNYHTAMLKSNEECLSAISAINEIQKELNNKEQKQ